MTPTDKSPLTEAHKHLDEAIASLSLAVEQVRELDTILPDTRRKLNAKVDDLSVEEARLGGAMQRLQERSQSAQVLPPAIANGGQSA